MTRKTIHKKSYHENISPNSLLDQLPEELLLHILNDIDYISLIQCEQVSRRWARLASNIWMKRFECAKRRPEFPVWHSAPNQRALPDDPWLPLAETPQRMKQHCVDVQFAQTLGKKLVWIDSGVFLMIATSHTYAREHPSATTDTIKDTYTEYLYKTEVILLQQFPNVPNVVQVRTSQGPLWILANSLRHPGVKYEVIASHEGNVLRSRILGDPYLFCGFISISDPLFRKIWMNILLPCILHDLWTNLPFVNWLLGNFIRYAGTFFIGVYTIRTFLNLRPILGFSLRQYPKTSIFLRVFFVALWISRIWLAPRLYVEMCYISYIELGLGYFLVWYLAAMSKLSTCLRIVYTSAIVLLFLPLVQYSALYSALKEFWPLLSTWWIYVQLRLEALLHLLIITALESFVTPPKLLDFANFFVRHVKPLLNRPVLFALGGASLYVLFFPQKWW